MMIITMDADLQDSRKTGFISMITIKLWLISAGKKKRYDSVVAKTFRLNYLIGQPEKHLGTVKWFQLMV
jgi:hypothetical protein